VSVSYPLLFSPGDVVDVSPEAQMKDKTIGIIGHKPVPCGPGADLPLSERRTLWAERLSSGNVDQSLSVYRNALSQCEATNWRERVALLVLMVDSLPTVLDRVSLWRALLAVSPSAADAVYRFLVLRVRTAEQLRQLHEALGFEQVDPDVLANLLARAKDPRERLTLLRGTAEKFPDDSELALQVLWAYEDAGDEAGGRAWARKLRARVDATSHLRTSVGEYYLRLAENAPDAKSENAKYDEAEGRRTFGEIVEFASEDPLARRHLGDLLSAHGWHAEALRQYETLQRLTPDDPTVHLLLARAAQGTGKTERAVRLTERAAATGAPDSDQPVTIAARALASVFLAEARTGADKANKKDELARLRGRAGRLASGREGGGVRVILTWSHPELRPTLWTNALGSMMPSADNLPLLGVAEAQVSPSPGPEIEIRLDPEDAAHAARLGLTAQLLVMVNEGEDNEVILTRSLRFQKTDDEPPDRIRFKLHGKLLTEDK
jgi:Ca-activated chloride channel family protein